MGVSVLVLVPDVADDLLEQIFDGDQPGNAAIFVDDDAHVLLFALHLAQQFIAALGLRDEGGRPLNFGNGAWFAPPRP